MDFDKQKEEKKQKIYGFIKDKDYKPMKIREMMVLLNVLPDERMLLKEILDELISEGKIVRTNKGKYVIPKSLEMFIGTFEGKQSGYGFVVLDDDSSNKDIFVPKDFTNGAMHKDTVMCRLIKHETEGKRPEAEVVQIIKRGTSEIVGTFKQNKNFGFVIPDSNKYSKDIYISKKEAQGAVTGSKVVVKITRWSDGTKNPEGKIIEILGHISEPTTEILAIIKQFDIPVEFPDKVKRQVNLIPKEVDEKDKVGREDLRSIKMVTIDGEDAKDLDDAVSLEKISKGIYRLGVHIADVTHYVKKNEPLDKEALKRGTSVYLVDRVIPMLPRKLSNGICSLNAHVDRLALSCIMDIDDKGNVINHRIAETLINIDKRMTYTNVKKILEDEDDELLEEYKDFVDLFKMMKELAIILRNKRFYRGSIDFNFEEAKIVLNDKGKPVDIKPYERNIATHIIEEFMLITNETIAEDYYWQDIPFVYRSHEEPDPEKIQHLAEFIHNFGYNIKGHSGKIHPKSLQQILDDVEGTDEETIISRLVLRSMKQAKYTATSEGHFGLAAKYYCHFTSPIRRYPDLQIHRIIKQNLNGELSEDKISRLRKNMPKVSKQCSLTERRAEDAERETEKYMKVQYMSEKIGECFEGVISSITNWGMYIELPNTVEGLVHVTNMNDDYYDYYEKQHVFIGERTKKIYRLGDRVSVRLIGTDNIRRTIDFIIEKKDNE